MESKEAAILMAIFGKKGEFNNVKILDTIFNVLVKGTDFYKELTWREKKRYEKYLVCCTVMKKTLNEEYPDETDEALYRHIANCDRCRDMLMEFTELSFFNFDKFKEED